VSSLSSIIIHDNKVGWFLSLYNLDMLSLTPIPEMFLTWLVELFTWFSCLVLRRNQKIHSLLIKFHGLIHRKLWRTLWWQFWLCFKRRDCKSSFSLWGSIIWCMYKGLEHMEYMEFMEYMELWNSWTRVYVDDYDW